MKKLISLALCFSIANILLSPLAYAQNKDYSGKTLLDAYKLAGDMRIEMNIPQHYAENQKKQETSERLDYNKLNGDIPRKFEDIFNKTFTKNKETGEYSANNAEHLGDVPANNFLKKFSRCEDSQVVLEVDDTGTPRCGNKNNNLFVKIRIHSGSITAHWPEGSTEAKRLQESGIKKNGKTYTETLNTGEKWYVVDYNTQLVTEKRKEVEIVFEDDSLMRLEGASISIEPKVLQSYKDKGDSIGRANNTLAQVTYEKGLLWGRVLNKDIVQFNHNNLIAGVRGTSIMINDNGMHVIQSKDNEQSKDNNQNAVDIFFNQAKLTPGISKVANELLFGMKTCQRISLASMDAKTLDQAKKISVKNMGSTSSFATDYFCGFNSKVLEHSIKDVAYLRKLYTDRRDNEQRTGDNTRGDKNPTGIQSSVASTVMKELESVVSDTDASEMRVSVGNNICKNQPNNRNIMWSHMRIIDPEVMCRNEKTVGMIVFDNGVPTVYVRDEKQESGVRKVDVKKVDDKLKGAYVLQLKEKDRELLEGIIPILHLQGDDFLGKILYNSNVEIIRHTGGTTYLPQNTNRRIDLNKSLYAGVYNEGFCLNNKPRCVDNLVKINSIITLSRP